MPNNMPDAGQERGILMRLVSVAAAAALAVTFVIGGLFACSMPQTTQLLAQLFSGSDNPTTPFSHEQLVDAAVATRDYTVGSHDRDQVTSVIERINQEADTPFANSTKRLVGPNDVYTLDNDALTHLDDVYNTVSWALGILGTACMVAAALLLFLGFGAGRRRIGNALLLSGTAVIVVFVVLAIGAVVDFNGFFAFFHSLFFADGSWTFSYDSLLITMYPIAFWMGMGGVWLAVSAGLSILAIVLGLRLRRSPSHKVPCA